MFAYFSTLWTNFINWLSTALSTVFAPVLQQFHDLGTYIGTLVSGIWSNAATFFSGIATKIGDWLATLTQSIADGFSHLYNLLVQIFQYIYMFFEGLIYLVHQLFSIVVLIVQLVFQFFNLLYSIGEGLINTLASLGFTGSTTNFVLPTSWGGYFGEAFSLLHTAGFDAVAYVLMFFIWFWTAMALVRIIGSGH